MHDYMPCNAISCISGADDFIYRVGKFTFSNTVHALSIT